jgi:hypothetical protein
MVITSASSQPVQATSLRAPSTTRTPTAAPPSDQSSLSGPAAFLAKLSDLKKSDPQAFTAAVNEIAQKLNQAASTMTDAKSQALTKDLASKFSDAGKSGDLSAVAAALAKPTQGPREAGGERPHGPPPGGGKGGGGGSGSSASKVYDPADTNLDGTVSDEEAAAYKAKLAARATSTQASKAYASQMSSASADATRATVESLASAAST